MERVTWGPGQEDCLCHQLSPSLLGVNGEPRFLPTYLPEPPPSARLCFTLACRLFAPPVFLSA